MHRTPLLPVLALVLAPAAGCVRTVGYGPDLGACADPPDEGTYAFGQAGIGTCLSGPVAMSWRVARGETWLAVTNADPFRSFATGSLLQIDESSLATLSGTVPIDTLRAHAVATEPFVSGLAFVGDRGLVASRLSEGEVYRGVPDRVWLFDAEDPAATVYGEPRFLPVGSDPFAVVPDPSTGRVYVVDSVTPSVSIVDLGGATPDLLDTAPRSRVTVPSYAPTAGRPGQPVGVAEAEAVQLDDQSISRNDAWTLTWIEGTTRLFVPERNGLQRWTSGGDGVWRPHAVQVEVLPTSSDAQVPSDPGFGAACPDEGRLDDPWLVAIEDSLVVFAREVRCTTTGEAIASVRTAATAGAATSWIGATSDALLPRAGWSDVGGPSLVDIQDQSVLFFDGTWEGDEACPAGPSIGRAPTDDGLVYEGGSPVVCLPPGFTDMAQPSLLADPVTGRLRMWMSLFDGTRWVVGHTRSTDAGRTWEPVDVVIEDPTEQVGAPVVAWIGGRYRAWMARADATGWRHVEATSVDGLTWTAPLPVTSSDRPVTEPPPRVAVQPAATRAWRLEGEDAGQLRDRILEGTTFVSSTRGFQVQVASGHVAGRRSGAALDGGLEPGSLATPGGQLTLYATGTDADGRARIVALRSLGSRWLVTSDDLVPPGTGGNAQGARDPVVWQADDGTWQMVYAARQGDVWSLRRATSADGLVFRPADLRVTGSRASWESLERLPHSLTRDGDTLTLWYSGTDGGRYRVGALTSTDGVAWTPVRGRRDPFLIDVGDPGSFDDSGVRDPVVVREGDVEWLLYGAFDGDAWTVGQAWRRVGDAEWVRTQGPLDPLPRGLLAGVPQSFSDDGARSPVLLPDGSGFLYAGTDGFAWRVGEAALVRHGTEVDGVTLPLAYPAHRLPQAGDAFAFDTVRGTPGRASIPLDQVVDGYLLPGVPGTQITTGYTAAALDRRSGMLFVGAKELPGLLVIDVRDDASTSRTDRNYLDIEAVLRFETTVGTVGIHDMVLGPDGLLYLTVRSPDGVLVVDPTEVVDDDTKDMVRTPTVGLLPLHDLNDDDGDETFAAVGASGLDITPDGRFLIAAHLRDNSLTVFDLTLGPFGEEIRHIEDVGENPNVVKVSPDGRYAVVATYLGDGLSASDGSELVVLDLDPASPTFLEITGRVVNR